MLGFEKLVEFSEKEPKTVIISLITILIVGSLAGGFWINYLHRKNQDKIEIIEERYKNISLIFHSKNQEIESGVNKILKQINFAEILIQKILDNEQFTKEERTEIVENLKESVKDSKKHLTEVMENIDILKINNEKFDELVYILSEENQNIKEFLANDDFIYEDLPDGILKSYKDAIEACGGTLEDATDGINIEI